MKRMTLTDDEVEVVIKYRQEKAAKEFEKKQAEIRAGCDHDFKFDFHNYKTTYYKCCKCGQGTTNHALAAIKTEEI